MFRNPSSWQQPATALGPPLGLGLFLWLSWNLPDPWFWSLVLGLVILPQAAGFATTIYLHRYSAHRSLRLRKLVAWGFRCTLWILTSVDRRQWVAVHRKHHTFTDEEGDPHSPFLHGILRIQLLNVLYYARAARDPKTIQTWAPDISPDWWDRHLFGHPLGSYLGPIGGVGALVLLLGPNPGLVAAFLHAVMYVFGLSSSINGLCHWWGYRTFPNTATNIPWLAWLTGGEALHNNHHSLPTSPSFRVQSWEVDLGWIAILAMKMVGAITFVGKTISQQQQEVSRV